MSEQKSIPLSAPYITENAHKYISDCLDSGWVSSVGKYVVDFENAVAKYTGAKNAVACVNGTSALHLSYQIAGLKADDEVLVPTLTFIAPINAIKYCNAHPVFFDCDDFFNINLDSVEKFLNSECTIKSDGLYNKSSGRKIWGIVPVHIFGGAVDMQRVNSLAKKFSLRVVEDASESLGSDFKGKQTGTFGELGCLSFNGNKIITTGGGGMILTDNEKYAEQARYLSTQAKDDALLFVHDNVGYNYRLTNIQAALGLSQIEQLKTFIEKKKKSYSRYKELLSGIKGLKLADFPRDGNSNFWFFSLIISQSEFGHDAISLMKHLRANAVEVRPIWQLNHLQKPYSNCQSYDIKLSPKLIASTINLPCSVGLKEEDIIRVCDLIKQAAK